MDIGLRYCETRLLVLYNFRYGNISKRFIVFTLREKYILWKAQFVVLFQVFYITCIYIICNIICYIISNEKKIKFMQFLHINHNAMLCNFLGGISAAITTPLDVAKTRIMLANRTLLSSELTIPSVLHRVYGEKGFTG